MRSAAAVAREAGIHLAAAYSTTESPWGRLFVAATAHGIAAIELSTTAESFADALRIRLHGSVLPDQPGIPESWRSLLGAARTQLEEYFRGEREGFDLPVDWTGIPTWDRRVLEATRELRYGVVSSYGRIAASVGSPRAARAVGNALGHNPMWLLVPCHRVIAGDGSIGGYGGGRGTPQAVDLKRGLLRLEGVELPIRFAPAAG